MGSLHIHGRPLQFFLPGLIAAPKPPWSSFILPSLLIMIRGLVDVVLCLVTDQETYAVCCLFKTNDTTSFADTVRTSDLGQF